MVKLDVTLVNFEEFKSNYEKNRGSRQRVILWLLQAHVLFI